MRARSTALQTAATAVLGLALLGQGTPDPPQSFRWGPVQRGCRLGLDVRGVPMAGDAVNVLVAVELVDETSTRELPDGFTSRPFGEGDQNVAFRLLDEDGKDVPMTLYGRRAPAVRWGPNWSGSARSEGDGRMTTVWSLQLHRLFDTSLAGHYRLQVSHRFEQSGGPSPGLAIVSTELAFELVEEP